MINSDNKGSGRRRYTEQGSQREKITIINGTDADDILIKGLTGKKIAIIKGADAEDILINGPYGGK